MDKNRIRDFFDRCAPGWEAEHPAVIDEILDNAGVVAGCDVLDVACGTGVLFPDYLQRKVASLTAIDLSPEMARLAQESCPEARVLCGDAETVKFEKKFDNIVIYNAFPHFPEPENLIRTMEGYLKTGGRLTVAHGMSREKLARHHEHCMDVSRDLPEATGLADLFAKYLDVTVVISDDRMYQVVGVKR